jgi:Fe-S cluster assembly protein SufD
MTVMTADPRIQRTKAEEALAAAYLSARGTLPGGGSVLSARDRAFAAFQTVGLPGRRVEAWK